ncbi:uncharacterized protein LOC135438068 [Drosophila montana]|uniref:uncharacterized protein LOC135438068 n=1 Tax=Drosophila montana TaxID=40370 RepID=UPI00313BEF6E
MGSLQPERLSTDKPLRHVGVDFCGPVITYLPIRGKGPTKSYIAIYVCMAVKAVHIEIVSDLSTNKFLESLKRMVARRGPVSQHLLASHFGGLWEADGKSAKGLLVRTLANTRFTFEELNTAVVEIEADTLITNNISNLDRYEQITAVKQQFWSRWSAEYVDFGFPKSLWSSYMRTTHRQYTGN